jgi:C-terminal peptidase prc
VRTIQIFRPFFAALLIALTAFGLRDCTAPAAVAPEIEPSPTALPTLVPTDQSPNEEYLEIFEAVWGTVNETYFDPEFGGLDWDGVHNGYEPLVAAAGDEAALYQLLNQMLWELNVSHTGVGPADLWWTVEPVAFARAEIGVDVRLLDDQAVVTRVEAGSPAEAAGLRPGFVIRGIDGVSVEQILAEAEEHLSPPYNERSRIDGLTRHLLSLIYGEPETAVSLVYLDEGNQAHEQEIERQRRQRMAPMAGIPLPASYLEFESERLEDDVGYIRFNTFHPDLIPDIEAAVAALEDARGIIIDLRGNPGGDLSTGQRLAAQFLDRETSFGAFIAREETWDMRVAGEGVYAGPVVILIDTTSYSCSEWFAAGMQAAGRAVVIGERSPGGVTAMNVVTLPYGASLGYPVAQIRTPDGTVLEGHGVIPDVAVSLDRAQLLAGVDAQLEAGIRHISEASEG